MSTDYIFKEKGEPKRIRTEALVRVVVKVVDVVVAAVVAVGFMCDICKTPQKTLNFWSKADGQNTEVGLFIS